MATRGSSPPAPNPTLSPSPIRSYVSNALDTPSPTYSSTTSQFSHSLVSQFQRLEYYNASASGAQNTLSANSQQNPDLSTTYLQNLTTTGPTTTFGSQYPTDQYNGYDGRLPVPIEPWSGWPVSSSAEKNVYQNGDFDNTLAWWPDGPSINKPDEGDTGGNSGTPAYVPYFFGGYTSSGANSTYLGTTYFTPNRVMPSPGMFGSLPTGVMSNTPWQTLLFRPQPIVAGSAANYYAHTEAAVPSYHDAGYNQYTTLPDHLMMDLFWMPIVEPYAISNSFSTAGKINMNYQIEPFTYIDRSTPLVCLLKSERIPAVPDTADWYYKDQASTATLGTSTTPTNFRLSINPAENQGSLRQFLTRFDAGDIFRSPSEICDIFLVPNNTDGSTNTFGSDAAATAFWATHRLTGDNSRERPYTNLYGRLTTKSNTFTLHMRVQSLKQSVASRAAGEWVQGTDTVTGEYRGSTLIERYLDPNASLVDYAANPTQIGSTGNLDSSYQFRIVRSTQFAP